MPELPEVETIVRDLSRVAPGRAIAAVEVLRPDLVPDEPPEAFAAGLTGARIRSVTRRAKNILFDLGERGFLRVNLGMTGRLLAAPPDAPLDSHLGARFTLNDGSELRYHDVRRFGLLARHDEDTNAAWDASLGAEPLSGAFTPEHLAALAARSRVAVKTWLMDQRRIVGVGNIYASEALFRAGIDPRRPANTLTPAEVERLHEAVRGVLTEAIEFRGTTLLDYRDASGERGGFARRLRVYDRAGEPCTTCGAAVDRIVQGGRSTFFCAHCQR